MNVSLLLKLQRHGIDGSLLLWIRNFLTNRRQRVVLRGSCSDWSPVVSGVPHGTVLDPILFIIYINDILTNVTLTVTIYADDTKIYRTINEPDKNIPAIQLDLNRLSDWATKWQLRFNLEKCEVMRATHSRDRSKPSSSLAVQLKSVETAKDLRVTINYDLSWGKHVSYIVNKANKVLGVIKRSLRNDNRYAFSCLFKSLVRPILEYAAPVWSPYQKRMWNPWKKSKEEHHGWR